MADLSITRGEIPADAPAPARRVNWRRTIRQILLWGSLGTFFFLSSHGYRNLVSSHDGQCVRWIVLENKMPNCLTVWYIQLVLTVQRESS